MRTQTSESDYIKFQRYCKKELAKHRLGDWIVSYGHEQLDNDDLSHVVFDLKMRMANIRLGECWDCDINDGNLKKVALHEVLHITLAKLVDLAESRFVQQNDINETEHDIIDRMVYAKFGDMDYTTNATRTEGNGEEK